MAYGFLALMTTTKTGPMKNLYTIKSGDTFHRAAHPLVEAELLMIMRGTDHLQHILRGELIISYYKDHCLKVEWLEEHPELVQLISSRRFRATNVELLFDSCRDNKSFRESFENYIKMSFLMPMMNKNMTKEL